MKIITVTSQEADNYGAVLQAYALQQTLEKLGYENEILNISVKGKKSKKVILRNIVLKTLDIVFFDRAVKLSKRFKNFRQNCLKQTRCYMSIDELRNDPPKADIYLTGSDQVFALGNSLVPVRYLDFGDDSVKRVSYAASKGHYETDEKSVNYIKSRLSRFAHISLREEQAVEYFKNTLKMDAVQNIDPVFLLDRKQWGKVASDRKIDGPYILCFRMLRHDAFEPLLKKLKKETGYKIVSIQPRVSKHIKADKYLFDVTPQDFVQLIKNAEVVVTTSFHATAFSVLFQKKFYSLIDYKPERMISLCSMLGLSNRLVRSKDTEFATLDDIDYTNADSIIQGKRDEAFRYLIQVGGRVEEKSKT